MLRASANCRAAVLSIVLAVVVRSAGSRAFRRLLGQAEHK